MTQKQVKIGKSKKSQKVKQTEDEHESRGAGRRALLLSSDDVERMAVESSRARLINHLVSKSEDHSHREFASYYRGSSKYQEPPYSITSHTNKVPILKVPHVIPAYPSLVQTQRWCPHIMTTSPQGCDIDTMENLPYICKCVNCTSPNCPGKNSIATRKYKSNIKTFCDQCTMTRNVQDVGCGRTVIPSLPICSDGLAPCCSSMFAIIDDHCKQVHGRSGMCPAPILKKGCLSPDHHDCMKNFFCDNEACKSTSVKCFYKKERDECSDGEVVSRKNIYNEGISDVVTSRLSPCPKTAPISPACGSKTSLSSSSRNSYIPHSHRNESKYHKHCVDPPEKVYVQDNGTEMARCNYTVALPKLVARRACGGASGSRRCSPMAHNIRMPKKVLMSERVLDHGTTHRCNKISCRRK